MSLLVVVVSCLRPTTFQKSCECSSMNVGCTLFLAKPTIKYQKHVKKLISVPQDYYKSGRMLVKMAEAIGRLVLAGRELTRLAG